MILKDNRDNIKESLSQTASSCCQNKVIENFEDL